MIRTCAQTYIKRSLQRKYLFNLPGRGPVFPEWPRFLLFQSHMDNIVKLSELFLHCFWLHKVQQLTWSHFSVFHFFGCSSCLACWLIALSLLASAVRPSPSPSVYQRAFSVLIAFFSTIVDSDNKRCQICLQHNARSLV